MKTCFVSIDIEHDLDMGDRRIFHGVEEIDKILEIFESFRVPATLFVTGDVLVRFAGQVEEWAQKYEIASHSYGHIYFNELPDFEKEEDIRKFRETYEKVLGVRPLGFRAPSHVIDKKTFDILEKYGFAYDSSIVPHYPYFKRYRGYVGNAPTDPYFPQSNDIRQGEARGSKGKILEIPVAGQLMGVPLAGAWIRKLPIWLYRALFIIHKPEFITLSMHSWDLLDKRFAPKLVKILEILKYSGYVFKSGRKIAMERVAGQGVI